MLTSAIFFVLDRPTLFSRLQRATTASSQALVKPTVAKAFLGSMKDLNATLLATTCNFARCIKPNAQMQCGVYDNR